MLADYKVCIDACVLANYSVSDLLQKPQQRLAKLAVAIPRFAEHVADQWDGI
jgi:hypothetical protein